MPYFTGMQEKIACDLYSFHHWKTGEIFTHSQFFDYQLGGKILYDQELCATPADTNMLMVEYLPNPYRFYIEAMIMYVNRDAWHYGGKFIDHECWLELIVGTKQMAMVPCSLMNRYIVIPDLKMGDGTTMRMESSYVQLFWRPLIPFIIEQGERISAHLFSSHHQFGLKTNGLVVPDKYEPLRIGVVLEGTLLRSVP